MIARTNPLWTAADAILNSKQSDGQIFHCNEANIVFIFSIFTLNLKSWGANAKRSMKAHHFKETFLELSKLIFGQFLCRLSAAHQWKDSIPSQYVFKWVIYLWKIIISNRGKFLSKALQIRKQISKDENMYLLFLNSKLIQSHHASKCMYVEWTNTWEIFYREIWKFIKYIYHFHIHIAHWITFSPNFQPNGISNGGDITKVII